MDQSNLPPAAKLAALIEAGRAANPNMKHGRFYLLTADSACANGFACLALGLPREQLRENNVTTSEPYNQLREAIGLPAIRPEAFAWDAVRAVANSNDRGDTLDEIILSLHEGELAKCVL